jgi:hypothetical protein
MPKVQKFWFKIYNFCPMLGKVKKLPEKLRKNIMRRETVKGFQTVPWNSAWTKHNSSALQKCSTSGLKIRFSFFHEILFLFAAKNSLQNDKNVLTFAKDNKGSCHAKCAL